MPSFTTAYQQSLVKPDKFRQRALGGGRKATLRTILQKLLYILLYGKCYPTFDLLSGLFNFERSCAHDWVHRLLRVLETTLGYKQVLPLRKLRSVEEFIERFPTVKAVIIDGTERPVQRPQDPEKQKAHDSGQKKRHTRKHITGYWTKTRVILLTKARPGKVHDKRQFAAEPVGENIPEEVPIEGDLGFQGLQNEFENIHLPHKSRRARN